jgi:diguanylate cyclase (GGDEF)-like protein
VPDLDESTLQPARLLEVIRIQGEVAALGPDLAAVMTLVVERASALTGAAGSVVELAEGDDMVYRAAAGCAEAQLGLRLRRDGSLSGHCVALGLPILCPDAEQDPRVDIEACRRVGLRSMIVVPLLHQEQAVGVLKVISPDVEKFSEQDSTLLTLMSGLIASAMANAVRYQEHELFHLATHDPLTGLANRSLFMDRLRSCLARVKRHPESLAVLILDMNGLKAINDHHGHRAGDAAIVEVATRVTAQSRQGDTVARIGGDEFGVLMHRVDSADGARKACIRYVEAVQMPFAPEGMTLPLAVSAGHALFPDDGEDAASLLETADRRMYEMKRACLAGRAP